jgi:hypothetical protein
MTMDENLFSAWQKTPNFQKLVPAQTQLMRMAFFPAAFLLFIILKDNNDSHLLR